MSDNNNVTKFPTTVVAEATDGALERVANNYVTNANKLVIDSDEAYLVAVESLKQCKRMISLVDDHHDPIVDAAHNAHKVACDARRRARAPFVSAADIYAGKIGEYRDKQEAERRVREQLLLESARKLEEDRLLDEAVAAEAAGDAVLAAEIIDTPVEPLPVFRQASTPKVAGISFREPWDFEVVDVLELAKHVVAHPEDRYLISPNTTEIRRIVNARKDLTKIGGVRVFKKTQVASSRR